MNFRKTPSFARRSLLIGFGFIVLLAGSGCQTVQPWERGTLADYTMRPDRDSLAKTLKGHVYYTREAASGGEGVGGGGCGCN
jgi:hypothetical protein